MASNYDLDYITSQAISAASGIRMYDANKTRTVNNELGKDEFLKVLVAQMSNQDPTSPTSDTEFISQMAQFTALEQMQNVAKAMDAQRAYSMIGKDVTATSVVDSEGNTYAMDIYGTVTGVSKLKGVEYLVVYDYKLESEVLVPPSSVRTVFDNPDATTTMQLESIYNLLKDLLTAISNISITVPPAPAYDSSGTDSLLRELIDTVNTLKPAPEPEPDPSKNTEITDNTDNTDNTQNTQNPGGTIIVTGDPDGTNEPGGSESTGGAGSVNEPGGSESTGGTGEQGGSEGGGGAGSVILTGSAGGASESGGAGSAGSAGESGDVGGVDNSGGNDGGGGGGGSEGGGEGSED